MGTLLVPVPSGGWGWARLAGRCSSSRDECPHGEPSRPRYGAMRCAPAPESSFAMRLWGCFNLVSSRPLWLKNWPQCPSPWVGSVFSAPRSIVGRAKAYEVRSRLSREIPKQATTVHRSRWVGEAALRRHSEVGKPEPPDCNNRLPGGTHMPRVFEVQIGRHSRVCGALCYIGGRWGAKILCPAEERWHRGINQRPCLRFPRAADGTEASIIDACFARP